MNRRWTWNTVLGWFGLTTMHHTAAMVLSAIANATPEWEWDRPPNAAGIWLRFDAEMVTPHLVWPSDYYDKGHLTIYWRGEFTRLTDPRLKGCFWLGPLPARPIDVMAPDIPKALATLSQGFATP